MVVLVNTFGVIPLEDMIIVLNLVVTVHVLVEDYPLLLLWVRTITVNQELLMLSITLLITSMTHCGTDLVASLVIVVIPLPNHGFIVSCPEQLQII